MLVLGAALGTELTSWARSRQGAAGKCSEISLLNGAPYIYIQYRSSSSPPVANNDLARQLPRAALALACTIPLGLVILFDALPSSSANELS